MTGDVEFVDEESPRAADPAMIGLLEVVLAGIIVPGSSLVSSSRAASLAFWLWTEFSLTLALALGIAIGGLPRAAEMLSDIFCF